MTASKPSHLVLDTSAILHGVSPYEGSYFVTVPEVLEEIKKGEIRRIIDSYGDLLNVLSPGPESIRRSTEAARKSGDLQKMSRTDIMVVALALEVNGTILTNDYCIQNVAGSLGVNFQGVNAPAISRKVVWKVSCTGCGRTYEPRVDICPVCGHKTRRRGKAISDV